MLAHGSQPAPCALPKPAEPGKSREGLAAEACQPVPSLRRKKEIGVAGEWYLKDRTLGALTVEGQSGQGRVVCSLGKPSGGWRYVAAVVDRGAEETVAPSGLLPGRDVESPTQRVGGRCRAAIGSRRPNLGQQGVSFKTPEGHGRSLRFQVVDGRRPLIWGGGGRSEGADCFGMRGAFWADGRQDGEARGDRERERDRDRDR